ncbi:hypothetical protein H7F15_15370 [Pontibacter sp. Tf4]|uniref:hypothetical protein n=1 Tax=Pontibacter sp. Tf4 TaxID=2761620 RepID=UPI0016255EF8|nr:hypothetical protein [Pontibacter sp. Tf4]MBB6612426.1 hypothetical protein [Pontibacter sp. Tf4]
MKTKLSFLLSWLLLFLSSCHTQSDDFISKYCPGSCTVIKGKLTTDGRTKPLAGVTLEVNWYTYSSPAITSNTRRKAITTTDANGNFELRFLIQDDELPNEYTNTSYFQVKASADKNTYLFCLGDNLLLEYTDLERNTTINANYNLPRKAQLVLQVSNPQAMANGDNIQSSILMDAGVSGTSYGCSVGAYLTAGNAQTTIAVAANEDIVIRSVKNKAGSQTTSNQTIRLAPGQVLQHQITF